MLKLTTASNGLNFDESTIDEIQAGAYSSLNSMEYLTAVTLGIAKESCHNAAKESEFLLSAHSPWQATLYLSISPINLLADISKHYAQLQEATHNYYKYVNTDFTYIH